MIYIAVIIPKIKKVFISKSKDESEAFKKILDLKAELLKDGIKEDPIVIMNNDLSMIERLLNLLDIGSNTVDLQTTDIVQSSKISGTLMVH